MGICQTDQTRFTGYVGSFIYLPYVLSSSTSKVYPLITPYLSSKIDFPSPLGLRNFSGKKDFHVNSTHQESFSSIFDFSSVERDQ